jgi:hypothetical protein
LKLFMPFYKSQRTATACRSTCPARGDRIGILLIADTPAVASGQLEGLKQAGFDVGLCCDPAEALRICRPGSCHSQVIVVVESDRIGGMQIPQLTRKLVNARPDLPCVLLPVGASVGDAEVAVRTAMRWTSVGYVAAVAAS